VSAILSSFTFGIGSLYYLKASTMKVLSVRLLVYTGMKFSGAVPQRAAQSHIPVVQTATLPHTILHII